MELSTNHDSSLKRTGFELFKVSQMAKLIAQQAFLLAWQKQRELKDPDRFAGWIKGIVANVARNERRLKENRVQKAAVEYSESHAPSTNVTPQYRASRSEQNELLWNSLNQIPLEYREPLVLFYREDLSVAAVAEQLELSHDVVPKSKNIRHTQVLSRDLGVVLCLLVLLLWATGSLASTQGTVEGYPIWVVLTFIITMCTGIYFVLGYAKRNAQQRELRSFN